MSKKRGDLTDIYMNWWDENLGSLEENSSLLCSCTRCTMQTLYNSFSSHAVKTLSVPTVT